MKIRVLDVVNLNLGEGLKRYSPSSTIYEINEEFAKKENLKERYLKFPKLIEIIEEEESNGRRNKKIRNSK